MKDPIVKVTEFVGHASGDMECFCFDKRTPMQEELDMNESYRDPYDPKRVQKSIALDKKARVYPDSLLPEGSTQVYRSGQPPTPAPQGKWRITVEFWPDE